MSQIDPVGDLPSARLLGRGAAEPLQDIPKFLRNQLEPSLIQSLSEASRNHLNDIATRLHVDWIYDDRYYLDGNVRQLVGRFCGSTDEAVLLDFIQLSLRTQRRIDADRTDEAEEIEYILELAGSIFAISPDGLSVVHRTDQTATSAAQRAVTPEDEAAEVLAEAWSEAFGREPNAQDAWSSAIRAVEAVLIPILWPDPANRGKQTLSSATRRISDAPDKWKVEHPKITVETLLAMLRSLAYEPKRHGADSAEPATVGDAAACVHLAVTLVSWLRAGLLRPG